MPEKQQKPREEESPGKTPEQAEGARDPGDKRAEVDPGKTPDSDGERE
jgi:hypothetical protein